MQKVKEIVHKIYNELKNEKGGNVADYIPELACVNPDFFGVSICHVNGEIYNVGDCEKFFCLQSCSKPLSYCIAYDQLGKDELINMSDMNQVVVLLMLCFKQTRITT